MSDNNTSPTLTTHNVRRLDDRQLRHYHDRPKMIILVGYPGVGKSYYCTGDEKYENGHAIRTKDGTVKLGEESLLKKHFPMLSNKKDNYVIISTDEIIRDMAGDGYQDVHGNRLDLRKKPEDMSVADYVYQERKEQIRATRDDMIKKAAAEGKYIVIDALNVSKESRQRKIGAVLLRTDTGGATKQYGFEAVVIHPPESFPEYTRRLESRAIERRNTTKMEKLREVCRNYEDPVYDSNLDMVHELGKWPDRNSAIPKPECYRTENEVARSGR